MCDTNSGGPASSAVSSADVLLQSWRATHYKPLTPPSVRYTFLVMPTMPSFASSAVNAAWTGRRDGGDWMSRSTAGHEPGRGDTWSLRHVRMSTSATASLTRLTDGHDARAGTRKKAQGRR